MKEYKIHTRHMPTGDTTSFFQSFASREHALEHVNYVNSLHANIIQGKFMTYINPEDLDGKGNC